MYEESDEVIKDADKRVAAVIASLEKTEFTDFQKGIGEAVASIPFDFAHAMWQRHELSERAQQELVDLEKETADRIQEIRDSEVMTTREQAQEIEEIERESARRRRDIEKDLAESKKSIMWDVVQNFLAGTAQMIEAELQRRAAIWATNQLFGEDGGGGSQQSVSSGLASRGLDWLLGKAGSGEAAGSGAGLGGLGEVGASASQYAPLAGQVAVAAGIGWTLYHGLQEPLKDIWNSIGFDVPLHDAMAYRSGAEALKATHFQNPNNDFLAAQRGSLDAARELGRRSAEDLVTEHARGFEEQRQRQEVQPEAQQPIRVVVEMEPIFAPDLIKFLQKNEVRLAGQGRISNG